MSYKYSAFTENTSEMRKYLKSLGYKAILPFTMPVLYTFTHDGVGYYQSTLTPENVLNIMKETIELDSINCLGNPELFKAVTAIRKDSGIYQLYTDGNKWVESDIHDLLEIPDYLIEKGFDVNKTHKATLSELIEHFKI